MKQSFYYTVLFVLGFIAVIGVFSEPEPELDTARWITVFVFSKIVGFGAGYAVYCFMVRWENQGKTHLLDDEEEV